MYSHYTSHACADNLIALMRKCISGLLEILAKTILSLMCFPVCLPGNQLNLIAMNGTNEAGFMLSEGRGEQAIRMSIPRLSAMNWPQKQPRCNSVVTHTPYELSCILYSS